MITISAHLSQRVRHVVCTELLFDTQKYNLSYSMSNSLPNPMKFYHVTT